MLRNKGVFYTVMLASHHAFPLYSSIQHPTLGCGPLKGAKPAAVAAAAAAAVAGATASARR